MQAPKETERREENLFFNPFKPHVEKYPGLRTAELFENPITKDCLTAAKTGLATESLKTAMGVLNCEVTGKSQMALSTTDIRIQ